MGKIKQVIRCLCKHCGNISDCEIVGKIVISPKEYNEYQRLKRKWQ